MAYDEAYDVVKYEYINFKLQVQENPHFLLSSRKYFEYKLMGQLEGQASPLLMRIESHWVSKPKNLSYSKYYFHSTMVWRSIDDFMACMKVMTDVKIRFDL